MTDDEWCSRSEVLRYCSENLLKTTEEYAKASGLNRVILQSPRNKYVTIYIYP